MALLQNGPLDAVFEDVPVGRRSPVDLQSSLVKTPIKCGLYLDTAFTPLWRKPLAIQANRQWVINTVLNWYARPRTWERIWHNGYNKPVIITYINSFIGTPALGDKLWQECKDQFRARFGVPPFIIVGDSWKGLRVPDGYTSYALSGARFTRAGPLLHAGPGNIYTGTRSIKALTNSLNESKAFPKAVAVLIQSWSEWIENSQIEPSLDEGTAYLDAVTDFKRTLP